MLGWPVMYGGRSRTGIDCSGVLYLAAKNADLKSARDMRGYSSEFCDEAFVAAWRERMIEVSVDAALPADVILLRAGKLTRHSGLLTDAGTFIHANFKLKKVTETAFDALNRSLVTHAFRMREFG